VRLGHVPFAQARRVALEHLSEVIEHRFIEEEKPGITFNEAADSFLAYSASRKKSYRQDQFYVANLKAYFGNKPLDSLNLDLVDGYVHWRKQTGKPKGQKLMGSTINRDLTCLKTIVRRAIFNRQIERNPISGIKLFKETPRDWTLTEEEFHRLLSHCGPHLKPIVEIAYITGMRKGEILGLTWDKADFYNGVIILEADKTKTQEKREIPLDEGLIKLLKGIPKSINCPYVFNYRGKKLKSIRTAFVNACKRAGLIGFHAHDLRHCALSNMRRAGVPLTVVMSISGHKSLDVFRRYDHVNRTDRQKALENVRSAALTTYKQQAEVKAV